MQSPGFDGFEFGFTAFVLRFLQRCFLVGEPFVFVARHDREAGRYAGQIAHAVRHPKRLHERIGAGNPAAPERDDGEAVDT